VRGEVTLELTSSVAAAAIAGGQFAQQPGLFRGMRSCGKAGQCHGVVARSLLRVRCSGVLTVLRGLLTARWVLTEV
jgi:hypothetical protein